MNWIKKFVYRLRGEYTTEELIEMGMKLIKAGCKETDCADCPFRIDCPTDNIPVYWAIARKDGTIDEI